MPKYKMVVMTTAVEGREQEYNDWYQNLHLGQVVQIDGIISAQRYKVCGVVTEGVSKPYLAIYDIETDNVDEVVSTLLARSGTDELILSDAMDPATCAVIYEEIGPRVNEVS
jgi:hypothetical protein